MFPAVPRGSLQDLARVWHGRVVEQHGKFPQVVRDHDLSEASGIRIRWCQPSMSAGKLDTRHQANTVHLVLISRSPWILAACCHLQAVQRSRYAYGDASMAFDSDMTAKFRRLCTRPHGASAA